MWSHCSVMSKYEIGDTSASEQRTEAERERRCLRCPTSRTSERRRCGAPPAPVQVRRGRAFRRSVLVRNSSRAAGTRACRSLRDELDQRVHRKRDDGDVRPLVDDRSSLRRR